MNTIHNARVALLATSLNNLGVGSIITGLIGLLVNGRVGDASHTAAWFILGANLICLALGFLGRLRP